MNFENIPIIMTIAGSDSGSGAGIQADLKTIAALGGYGTSVITALTAQNTSSVDAIESISTDFIAKQFYSIISDFNVKAIKTGMLANIDIIECVAELIKNSNIKNYVLDPVIVATCGDKLINDNSGKPHSVSVKDIVNTLINKLIPLSKIITPNIPEAELLLNKKLSSINEMENFAFELLELGSEAVLLKGGHLKEEKIIDIFISKELNKPIIFSKNKIQTTNTHGTGCTLSAALATLLAQGYNWNNTINIVEKYMNSVISASVKLNIGKGGNGPLWHFFELY